MARTASFDREDVLARARDLFWKKGYHATSLKDLEEALALNPGSIYSAFGSKEGLFTEALEVYATGSRADAARNMDGVSPLEGLAAHARAQGDLCERGLPSNACMLVKTVLEFPNLESPMRQKADEFLSRMEAVFTERFRAAQAAGELPEDVDPARLGRKFLANIMGLRAYAQRGPEPEDLRDLADDIAAGVEALRVA